MRQGTRGRTDLLFALCDGTHGKDRRRVRKGSGEGQRGARRTKFFGQCPFESKLDLTRRRWCLSLELELSSQITLLETAGLEVPAQVFLSLVLDSQTY